MPVFGSSLLVGHVVASLARNIVATALVIAAGLLIGWDPSGSLLDWAAGLGMVFLFITAISRIAEHQPFTPIIETMRGLWMDSTSTGAPVGHEALIAVLWCAAILVISAFVAARLFRERSGA